MYAFLPLLLLSILVTSSLATVVRRGSACQVYASEVDDSASISQAFHECGRSGTITFVDSIYHVDKVLNTTGLHDCTVNFGNAVLKFSTDVEYWLANSIDVEFQNQSTAWLIGGRNLTLSGGTLDGSGQAWYDENKGRSNQPGRPIALTIFQSSHVLIDGLTFTQPQFWAAFVSRSSDVVMRRIQVSAISTSEWPTVNTDGADVWNSNRVLFEHWIITSGDDCIAAKGNTTNLHVRNVTCHGGNGMTVGSVGQYASSPDYVENVLFEDVRVDNAFNAAFIKTWQGMPVDNSTNGDAGGGGEGYVKNVTFRNFVLDRVALPIQITQCIYSEAQGIDCDSSKMNISDITWQDFTGTTSFNIAASLHCASRSPCPGIVFDNIELRSLNSTLRLPNYGVDSQDEVFQCSNLIRPKDVKCNKEAPANFGQIVVGNIPC
ncbi:hypothetical protein CBS101457_006914 [Exobasidium rhododendri]|nr:hypothetical protein CBS101457_006914 [Exobasidium rhododendri]